MPWPYQECDDIATWITARPTRSVMTSLQTLHPSYQECDDIITTLHALPGV